MTEELQRFLPFEPENAAAMAAYMKNHFPFCGVQAPERRRLSRPVQQLSRGWDFEELLQAIVFFYGQSEREYHYVAIDLAESNCRRLERQHLQALLPLLSEKQWWDSIDAWRKVYGDWCSRHPEALSEVFHWFFGHEDFWLRRIGITLQLKFKEQTDTRLLTKAVEADLATEEFFIQKAIGWALREYSKTAPEWVVAFIEAHPEMSLLARREALKHL